MQKSQYDLICCCRRSGMPYSDHVKPVKTAVDASQLDGYEELLDLISTQCEQAGLKLTKTDLKQMQSEFFRNLWAKGMWWNGLYIPMWFGYLLYGHPTDNQLKQLHKDSLDFVDFVEDALRAGQIVPVLEMIKLMRDRLKQEVLIPFHRHL